MDTAFVKAPATSANLGPGFDCLGVALSLWNQAEFKLGGKGLQISITGEGFGVLEDTNENLIVRSAMHLYQFLGKSFPEHLEIHCENNIPLGSGLGSSSAAIICGLLGANKLLGTPLNCQQLLELGVEIEGHPDNISPALYSGFTVSSMINGEVISKKIDMPTWQASIVLPDVVLSTEAARKILPKKVYLADAVQNIGNTALLIEALKTSDIELLRIAITDKLHQPYRLSLIPGAADAIEHAHQLGGAAALSGAGPSIIVFTEKKESEIIEALTRVFEQNNVAIKNSFQLSTLG